VRLAGGLREKLAAEASLARLMTWEEDKEQLRRRWASLEVKLAKLRSKRMWENPLEGLPRRARR